MTISSTRDSGDGAFYSLGAAIFIISAAVTIYFCHTMSGGMDMPGGWAMSMMWMPMPGQTWPAAGAMFMAMWLAMMTAMMLPSSLPMIVKYRRGLCMQGEIRPGISAARMTCGYASVWMIVGGLVYGLGVLLSAATMRWSAASRAMPGIFGVALVASGCWQFTRWKMTSLSRCRDPLACAAARPHEKNENAWHFGLRCGACCVSCCAAPMLALMILGMMDLIVMAIVAVIIALEKLLPRPEPIVKISGIALISFGLVSIFRALL